MWPRRTGYSPAVSPKMMIGLPGLNPIIPLWYGILALVVAMVVHEFSHGILSRVADVKSNIPLPTFAMVFYLGHQNKVCCFGSCFPFFRALASHSKTSVTRESDFAIRST